MMNTILKKQTADLEDAVIEYFLKSECADGSIIYSIEIVEHSSSGSTSCLLTDIARSEANAMDLLSLLSDNSVCPACAPFIIDDLADSVTFC